MTTEILRNALYGSGFDNLGYIVLDECHYMGDEGRGTVWEEIIISAPKDVALVGLSATVANVKEIADWISLVHRPIVAIAHPRRPVPLHYSVADLAGQIHEMDDVRRGRARVIGDEPRGPDDPSRWYTRRVVDPTVLIEALEQRRWLPAIYFIFSRAGCERAMEDVLGQQPPADHSRAAAGSGRIHRPGAGRLAGHRRIHAEPVRVPRPAHRRGAPPRRHPARAQAAHRDAVRARTLPRRLRHRDHVARHSHAGAGGGTAEPHQADRPRLPLAHAQRAHADGRPRGAPGHRSGGRSA